ncbi:MAG: pseudouridine synthase [Prolixibacteraceae bacterium]
MELEIIYRDEHLVAINKPHGLLVHKSWIAADAKEFAIQILRDQIGQRVTPVHRLDRKTSGVLLFALNDEANKAMNALFEATMVRKTYHALVRGFTLDSEKIDYPLKKENGNLQDAITNYRTLERVEVPVVLGLHQTQRYSVCEIRPETGRMHQIRKHFDHIRHPIIGDRPHGCNKQNKLFKEKWEMNTMLLHASKIEFIHPFTGEMMVISAKIQTEFERTMGFLGFKMNLTL